MNEMITEPTFKELGLSENLLTAIRGLGYEAPTPIQAQSIPVLLKGRDLVAQAETGTGKTGAFALPILHDLDLNLEAPQALILAPTRELAIQVAEAFKAYGKHLPGFHVLPIYGGQDYRVQLKGLQRGVHIVVGTPGRVMDHINRGTLILSNLKTLVLDEADEMLKMGFQEDVEWILTKIPSEHRTALFSATLPSFIKNLVSKYLKDPVKIQIKAKASAIPAIDQSYTVVSDAYKLEALTRFLEVREFDAAIIFTRTKNASSELEEKLDARGYAVAALNGDLKQSQRESVIDRIKRGKIDIIVATDVAARGLDVSRISFVINYDMPHDTESYIHRIGRTGRAGRKGDALLFVSPREMRMLKDIERVTQSTIQQVQPPSVTEISGKRIENLTEKVVAAMSSKNIDYYRNIVEMIAAKAECSEIDVAAGFASLVESEAPPIKNQEDKWLNDREVRSSEGDRGSRGKSRGYDRPREGRSSRDRDSVPRRRDDAPRGEGSRSSFDRDSAPRRRDDASRGEGRPSFDRDRAPRRRDDAPRSESRPSFDHDSAPRRRDDAPRGEGRSSFSRDSAPRRSDDRPRSDAPRSSSRAPTRSSDVAPKKFRDAPKFSDGKATLKRRVKKD
jgi:ATP-dependent RNA helicase DeaD